MRGGNPHSFLPYLKSSNRKWKQATPQLPRCHHSLPRWQLDKTLWRRQWMSSSVLGVKRKGSLSLTSKDGKITLSFSTTLGQLRTPLKPTPSPSTESPVPGPPKFQVPSSYGLGVWEFGTAKNLSLKDLNKSKTKLSLHISKPTFLCTKPYFHAYLLSPNSNTES